MQRLIEIDSLRGVAALSVVAFHFTYKYGELYGYASPLPFHASWGYLGVNLFFVISGFVIFMTLDRTRVPMDFVVSRASRLYPSYWTALLLTFAITHALGLPGKEVSAGTLLLNIPMFQQLFNVPLVDNVYWTLLVELLFYALAFALYLAGWLHHVLRALVLLLALRLGYHFTSTLLHVDLPWRISQLLILEAIPFFALGIVAYRLAVRRAPDARPDIAVALLALASLWADSPLMALVGLGCFLAVWLAAAGRLPFLQWRILVWFGVISYPLYLVHENIGWSIMRRLEAAGWRSTASVLVTTLLVVALAAAVSRGVERPAMAWIRARYRARTHAAPRASSVLTQRTFRVALAGLAALTTVFLAYAAYTRVQASSQVFAAAVARLQSVRADEVQPCPPADAHPFVLVALGQSNAGNHGATPSRSRQGVVWHEGRCYALADPLPGATGEGGSIWSRLVPAVADDVAGRPVVLAVLAVDATRASDWTREDRIAPLLDRLVDGLNAESLKPSAVLWQQGEADALARTPPGAYADDLDVVVARLRAHGVDAPVLLGTSTRCRNTGSEDLRAAVSALVKASPGLRAGADTDTIDDGMRIDGCHLDERGLREAARLWAVALQRAGVTSSSPASAARVP